MIQPTAAPLAAQTPALDDASLASLTWLRVLMVLCVVVPAVVFAAVAAYRLDAAEKEAQDRVRGTLRIANEHALKVFDTNETLLQRILELVGAEDDDAIRRNEATLHAKLVAFAANKPQIQALWVLGADGRPLVSSRFLPAPPDLNTSDRPYFRHHQSTPGGGVFMTEVFTGRATKDSLFNLSIGRYRKDGSFAGVVMIGLYPKYFAEFHGDLLKGSPALALTLIRQDGAVYSRTPLDPRRISQLPPGAHPLKYTLTGAQSGEFTAISSFDGRPRFVVLSKVGDYPAYVTAALETAAIRDAWLREMTLFALIAAIPCLGLIAAAVFATRRARHALQAAQLLRQQSEARRLAEEALLQSQKMEAIGRLTGGVAHDFNNALMVLGGNLYMLQKVLGGQHQRVLDTMGRAIESASKLTRQLLAFSRKQVLAPQAVRLQDMLPAMDQLLRPVMSAAIELRIAVDPQTPAILIDSAELELAILNLAMNARDAMPHGGRFELRARGEPGAAGFTGPVAVLEAVDTGTGIAPEIAERVFEPFFTTKPVGAGTGLGLSQVRGLCERSGGRAVIESEAGRGTIIRLVMPAYVGAPLPQEARPAPVAPLSARDRVLVVEDNAEVGATVVAALSQFGCSVVLHTNAADALQWLATHDRPDLLLTDVMMPGEVDGIGLAREVSRLYPGLRVVLMTGYAEQREALDALELPVLRKPFSPDMLARLLTRLHPQAA